MKRKIPLLLLGIFWVYIVTGQVTFSEHIAPIIYDNCTSCHRLGEIAPMAFTNYDEVAGWSDMIQYVTEIKYMPPWKPNLDYSHFVGERGLTDEEISLIADWVAAGVPQGDPALEPPLPDFPSGSQLGTPDLVIEMAEDYFVVGNNQDEHRVFVLPTGLTEDKEIAAVEFRPGNARAVHHALIAYETNGQAAAMDAQNPGYGYPVFGGFGVPIEGNLVGYTPGIQSIRFPDGIGRTLPAGADLLIQIHYAPLASDETDRSLVNIFYKDVNDPIVREVQGLPVTPLDLDDGFSSFVIPPNEVKSFHGTKTISEDISLTSVYPHCHYLGKDWEIFAVTSSGDTINIIQIEEWDFNWQGSYTFDRMKKIPAGSIVHVNATYDNTLNNPYNPNNPPQTMTWGEGTTDEMYLVAMSYVPYQAGDEDIVVGEIPTKVTEINNDTKDKLYPPFPNPTNGMVTMNCYLHQKQEVSIELFDVKGMLVKTVARNAVYKAGNHKIEFNTEELPAGTYMIRLTGEDILLAKSLVVLD